jgi:hypothetical protein
MDFFVHMGLIPSNEFVAPKTMAFLDVVNGPSNFRDFQAARLIAARSEIVMFLCFIRYAEHLFNRKISSLAYPIV